MKKTYNKPQAQVVNLYGEDVMLGASPVYDVDATKETNVIMSDSKGWNSETWTADED